MLISFAYYLSTGFSIKSDKRWSFFIHFVMGDVRSASRPVRIFPVFKCNYRNLLLRRYPKFRLKIQN